MVNTAIQEAKRNNIPVARIHSSSASALHSVLEEHCVAMYWNQELQARGISLVVLRVQNQKALMYVCRKQRLQERLDDQEVQNFLGKYGYVQKDADYALQRLKERLAKAEGFPHEIGVFLDYPLEDVVGFIENAGQNYKCSGCWKVYCNECETRKLFAKYKKCREVYRRLWKQGRDIRTLTVAS